MNDEVDFITNLSPDSTSGGWNGISSSILDQLSRRFETRLVGPINPPYPRVQKAVSALLRRAGGRGRFTLFSQSRLSKIAAEYAAARGARCAVSIFHGATPWISCDPSGPYLAYIDATFRQYIEVFSRTSESLDPADLARISNAEGNWLRRASGVLMGSSWVGNAAVEEYGLPADRCHTMWLGGQAMIPNADEFSGGHEFLFISLNFERKGGPIAVEALQQVRTIHPEATLRIIGQAPPAEVLATPGVEYEGFLNKSVESDLARFQALLASARGLVHPTTMDTMGAVLLEAGYHGCPSIATRSFGIPELVLHGETGLLLDTPIRIEQVAHYMLELARGGDVYSEMRRRAREDFSQRLSWSAFGDRLENVIHSVTTP